jgi:hypothetical protein
MAMNYHAQPRMTHHIDVVAAIGPTDVERIASLFEPEYYLSKASIRESIAHESVFNLIHHESVIKVDFIVRKKANIDKSNLNAGRKSQFSISQLTS